MYVRGADLVHFMLAVSDRCLAVLSSCCVFALSDKVLALLVVIVCFHAVALWLDGAIGTEQAAAWQCWTSKPPLRGSLGVAGA